MSQRGADRMVHVSFDLVDEFIPRIPSQRIEGTYNEEAKTKRICVSGDIHKAVRAIPQFAQVLNYMKALGLPLLIHAYYMESESIYKPTILELPDVNWTDEYWILERPEKVYRRDYIITDYKIIHLKDLNGTDAEFVSSIHFKPVAYQDNQQNLCKIFQTDSSKFPKNILFRTFLSCCGKDLLHLKKGEYNERKQCTVI